MMAERLSFELRKAVLKWYWKYENSKEVQRQWQNEFGTQPPTRQTIARIQDKFEASHTECATRNHRSVMCSHHTRHTDNRSSLSSSAASTLFSRW
jgi:hypothetical protein